MVFIWLAQYIAKHQNITYKNVYNFKKGKQNIFWEGAVQVLDRKFDMVADIMIKFYEIINVQENQ